ncbi:hypothetical protein GCM10010168_26480 [Actinoplanes ianthinogenes]|uniref:Uncharacterized protein n=1 Tax=Actinoplanes ianthinogenes TaxID=122358 RepID=A0ABM7M9I4_9ACTN|nr:hypothetical protein [Actinoplanes ianthinogenes]BCJ48288.1 hypothetical protein Aiant_89450 [Actinoplanes ianthinogenes]GGR07719.1 hypothetical protein GCM10010168_26480 [Actinoplanes ianthinogenes]
MSRVLPEADLAAIFGVLVVVHGDLHAEQLDPDLTAHLIRRLSEHGPLPAGASPGELNALLGDLCQRLHWAMGVGEDYPEPSPRVVTYQLGMPDEEAAGAVARQLSADGGTVTTVPSSASSWLVEATFPDLVPSAGHRHRTDYVTMLAEQHGGSYLGCGS